MLIKVNCCKFNMVDFWIDTRRCHCGFLGNYDTTFVVYLSFGRRDRTFGGKDHSEVSLHRVRRQQAAD